MPFWQGTHPSLSAREQKRFLVNSEVRSERAALQYAEDLEENGLPQSRKAGVCMCSGLSFFWNRSQGTRHLCALPVKSQREDMMLLARYAQDKTRGAAVLDYCQGLSWNLPLLFGLQHLCRNWGRCRLLPSFALMGPAHILGGEEWGGREGGGQSLWSKQENCSP